MTRKPYGKLAQADGIRLYEFMKKVLSTETVGETKYAVYAEGWDDMRVDKEAGKALNLVIPEASVKNLRQRVFGVIKPAQGGVGKTSALEERLAAIEGWLTKLDPNWRDA